MTADFKELLSIFNENGVKYMIVGAYAVVVYSEPRFTQGPQLPSIQTGLLTDD